MIKHVKDKMNERKDRYNTKFVIDTNFDLIKH